MGSGSTWSAYVRDRLARSGGSTRAPLSVVPIGGDDRPWALRAGTYLTMISEYADGPYGSGHLREVLSTRTESDLQKYRRVSQLLS